ncbi:response regulator transcription factor [Acidihalobacter ferrooxydans]|uniref:DNA-binding response regulator n=1 Tax=Acidihalobacter ferrooxydans TaxID=1765967 RepID=A0A1P8UDH3_9GAMM|nr:response regulator transcription factor [Acidihalobacter ferrooxydans]APZ41853.1 DNA-binding response regulator [Acidihalobacter ferrooxydans]
MRILIVEDDADLRTQMVGLLEAQHMVVDTAADGREGLYRATEYPLDLAIVDLGLPVVDGVEVVRGIRAAGKSLPVLVLTARGRWQDKVSGLEAGADDYLVKPVHPEELLARVRALLRRSGGWAQPKLVCGPIGLDQGAQQVTLDGAPVELTAYEYRVLEYLMLRAGEVVSKAALTEHIYAEDDERDSNVIEVFIRRLRRKLDPDEILQPIETLRGRGYRLNLERRVDAGEAPG